jgi:hypothetical protein
MLQKKAQMMASLLAGPLPNIPTRPRTEVPFVPFVSLVSPCAFFLGHAEAQELDASPPTGLAQGAFDAVEVALQIFVPGTTGVRLRNLCVQVGEHLCRVGRDVA